jgi:hypothetical protein
LPAPGGFEYFLFSATTLLWVNWFLLQFEDAFLAVILASIYGPFQVVGRLAEMKFGHHLDARITGLIAGLLYLFHLYPSWLAHCPWRYWPWRCLAWDTAF